jgi:hypothetical protein
MYAVFFVSPTFCSSAESHIYSVSPESSSLCSSNGDPYLLYLLLSVWTTLIVYKWLLNQFNSHQVSLFLETMGKKVAAVTPGSPYNLSVCQIHLIVWRICLVGVKVWTDSSCRWVIQES